MGTRGYVVRLADSRLPELLAELPAVMVTGPRAAGKTTSARRIAAEVLRLDDPTVAAAVSADPDAALRRAREPVLLDEWQEVPEVLGAVKRAVDDDPRPARFILTGSVEADLTQRNWPGTGRVVRLVLHGLTQREIVGAVEGPGLLEKVIDGDLAGLELPTDVPDIDGYIELALRGGFPEPALRLGPTRRAEWFDAYLDHVVTRDVRLTGQARDPVRLRRYLEVLGVSTAGLPTAATLHDAAGIDKRTATAYDGLLESLYLLAPVPAWSTNRLARLTTRAKVLLADAGIAASAARVDSATILRDGDLLGRMLDTFVAAQLRPELGLTPRVRLHHLRTQSGREEIDYILDLGAGRVLGIEVKATSAPTLRDARQLIWLRDKVGERFAAGLVLHTGPWPFELADRVWAVPICALWGPTARADRSDHRNA